MNGRVGSFSWPRWVRRLDAPDAAGARAFKDLLDHLEAWRRFSRARLRRALTGERPRSETLRPARRIRDRLAEGLAALPAAALVDPGHVPWLAAAALDPAVVRDAAAHVHRDRAADVRAWLTGRSATG